jgi:hypothetical protein
MKLEGTGQNKDEVQGHVGKSNNTFSISASENNRS